MSLRSFQIAVSIWSDCQGGLEDRLKVSGRSPCFLRLSLREAGAIDHWVLPLPKFEREEARSGLSR